MSSMLPPAVVVRGLPDARAALAPGRPVTLLSAPGAALSLGCLWWRELVRAAWASLPESLADETSRADILDCADAPGRAMEALRIGQRRLILARRVPGFAAVEDVARQLGGSVLEARPPALDLADRGAERRLARWLDGAV